MTRLVREDIFEIEEKIGQYDQYFMSQTGKTMAQIARTAAGVTGEIVPYGVTVIPVTSGLGIISTFSESVAAILKHAGIHAVVSKRTDVAGIQEAYLSGREIIFMADDDVFSASGREFAPSLTMGMPPGGDTWLPFLQPWSPGESTRPARKF